MTPSKNKILHLTLKKQWFDLVASGEKKYEFRKPSKWIASRLVGKEYDAIKFTNGYGKNKPSVQVEYKGYYINMLFMLKETYLNGNDVIVDIGDYVICLGEIWE